MRRKGMTQIVKVAGVGIVAAGIALGSVGSVSAELHLKGFDAGDTGGAAGARKVELLTHDASTVSRRPHRGRFGIGFVAE